MSRMFFRPLPMELEHETWVDCCRTFWKPPLLRLKLQRSAGAAVVSKLPKDLGTSAV